MGSQRRCGCGTRDNFIDSSHRLHAGRIPLKVGEWRCVVVADTPPGLRMEALQKILQALDSVSAALSLVEKHLRESAPR